jgi:hypothetical protein
MSSKVGIVIWTTPSFGISIAINMSTVVSFFASFLFPKYLILYPDFNKEIKELNMQYALLD